MVYVSLNFALKDVGINAVDITSFKKKTINIIQTVLVLVSGYWKFYKSIISQPLTQDIIVDKIILLIIVVLDIN